MLFEFVCFDLFGCANTLLTSFMIGGAVSQWSFSKTVLGRFSANRAR